MEGSVDGVEVSGESSVLTALLGAGDVICAPVDVEDFDESSVLTVVLGASDVVCAPADVEVADEESDDDCDGSARASPWPESTAAPTPSVIIRTANRLIPRTASLTRDVSHRSNRVGKRKQSIMLSRQ
jgi:hypothetical protein